jgi:glycerol-3-phosphate acyltransferase PlsY
VKPALLIIAAYLLGSIPFGYAAGRLARVDLTATGSGNTGATNVYRSLGLWGAVPVILLDVLKGFLPVWLFPMWDGKAWPYLAILVARGWPQRPASCWPWLRSRRRSRCWCG